MAASGGEGGVLFLLLVASSTCLAFLAVAVPRAAAARPLPLQWKPPLNGTSTSSSAVFGNEKRNEGSSDLVHMRYHDGPVLAGGMTLHLIWYGNWTRPQQYLIRDFLDSVSAEPSVTGSAKRRQPTVKEWWRTVTLYGDQSGANVSRKLVVGTQTVDTYSLGRQLTRLSMQQLIKTARTRGGRSGSTGGGGSDAYMVLTAADVEVQDFCRAVCGFHSFTFPAVVGYALPYAWVGNSEQQCPGYCAYPFAVPPFLVGSGNGSGFEPFRAPNGEAAVDGMISVMAHELAEMASNPLANGWYAGDDAEAPTEIADLCEGIYGTGGGGAYTGQVLRDGRGASFNVVGVRRRRFLVQWLWHPLLSSCFGPNALDQAVP